MNSEIVRHKERMKEEHCEIRLRLVVHYNESLYSRFTVFFLFRIFLGSLYSESE